MDGLRLCMRVPRRKHLCLHRGTPARPNRPGERWSMDFVHDQLFDGRRIRVLTVVDQWSRESPILEARFGFSGRVSERPSVHITGSRAGAYRCLAHGLQSSTATRLAGTSDTRRVPRAA